MVTVYTYPLFRYARLVDMSCIMLSFNIYLDVTSSYCMLLQKAAGDVKKGKFEPYAYLPLDYTSLNKR